MTEANRLHAYRPEVRLPTLVTSGRRDEAMALIASSIERGIAGSEWMLFEDSSHTANGEEAEHYRAVLGNVLARRHNCHPPSTHTMSAP